MAVLGFDELVEICIKDVFKNGSPSLKHMSAPGIISRYVQETLVQSDPMDMVRKPNGNQKWQCVPSRWQM
jgi:hypothetical protein